MKALLDSLGKKAVIHAELALGEGIGAVMMFPAFDMALQVYRENTTFDDIQIAVYEDYGKMLIIITGVSGSWQVRIC